MAVVVEDDDDISQLMAEMLAQSGFTVHQAGSGAAGVAAVREHEPVVVTVDLGLPDFDGYEVTRQVRRFSDAYVVMLTARTEEIDTLLGLEAGADDYVTKPFRPRELRARIEAMLRRPRTLGAAPLPPEPLASRSPSTPATRLESVDEQTAATASPSSDPAAQARLELDGLALYPHLYLVEAAGREIPLTPTEFLLLEMLLRSGQVVRSKAELARMVRGDEPDGGTFVSKADERTVEVHVGNLRRKLADDPTEPRWIHTVRGVGYRMTGWPVAVS
ncbi:MAG: response regulator transcription factor [Brachybacterium sp.]|nr:response regulator transcription factor [Brachybacterium sp.]